MRASQLLLSTTKETPADAEVISHQLMLRAGMIRKLAAGIYTWLPLGLRVLRKVEAIVREEMNRAGAQELLMPAIQPAELWQESGRWGLYGGELLRLKDRHQRDFCFGPTHEEVITDTARRELHSYKQLPMTFYQIQTKFRDEPRPRFGVMRAREFLMKDAYSFHIDQASLQETYDTMHAAYTRIFTRLGLNFRAVYADTGAIGGSGSQEFHVLAASGEDAIAFSDASDYAANVELAEAIAPVESRSAPTQKKQKIATPGKKSCEEVSEFLQIPIEKTVKSLAVIGSNEQMYLLLLRGDHDLNEVKARKILSLESIRLATEDEIQDTFNCRPGYIGPLPGGSSIEFSKPVHIVADQTVAVISDFVCGANEDGYHLTGLNFVRDLHEPATVGDIRNVVAGDPSPDGKGALAIARGIEVGHIFQLGTKYSSAMNATVLDQNGQSVVMTMGCYGIGVSRVVASAIEQNNDERGIIWPAAIAPFQVALLPMNMQKSQRVREAAEKLYQELQGVGIEVLFDDRPLRAGVMFADVELIGIPHRLVLGERGLDAGTIEYQGRRDTESQNLPLSGIVDFIKTQHAC